MTTPDIKQYRVIVKGTPLEDRKALIECLEENKQEIFSRSKVHTVETLDAQYFGFDGVDWCLNGGNSSSKTVTIYDFLKLFSVKHKQIKKTSKITLDDIINKKIAITVSSVKEILKLVDLLEIEKSAEIVYDRWLANYPYNLAIEINKPGLNYCYLKWYKENGYEIISFSEAISVATTIKKTKYQIGDVFKNSVDTICTIIDYNSRSKKYTYTSGNSSSKYTTKEETIDKNWTLIGPKSDELDIESDPFSTPKHPVSNLKPGDRVRVRSDLTTGVYYYMVTNDVKDFARPLMLNLKGTIVTIRTIEANKYHIKEGPSHLFWTDEMFSEIITKEPIKGEELKIVKQSKYNIGDRVKIREDLNKHRNTTTDMCKLAGEIVTLTAVKGSSRSGYEFDGFNRFYWSADMFEGLVIEETHSQKFKVGDLVELIDDYIIGHFYGNVTLLENMVTTIIPGVTKVTAVSQLGDTITLDNNYQYNVTCLKLYKLKEIEQKLAFYKESGLPWTEEELDNVRKHCGDTAPRAKMGPLTTKNKYIYYNHTTSKDTLKIYPWGDQGITGLTKVSYESIFGNFVDLKIDDTVYWNKTAEKQFGFSHKAGKLIGSITKIIGRPNTTPLLCLKSRGTSEEEFIDAGWVTKTQLEVIDEPLYKEGFNFILNNGLEIIVTGTSKKLKGEYCYNLLNPKTNNIYIYNYPESNITENLRVENLVQKEQEKQEEKTKQTKSTKKEETFMSKLKDTARQTGAQNVEAAKIAAKMEAGRVLNKQVIKHVKPHIPMLLRGYLDTPLAPVILANAAAMLGNHTGNVKVQKVAELMLLAAADTTVQAFNLDKIIDDVLTGIKLPAGILDADEE